MNVLIKICGLKDIGSVAAAVAAGADCIGFVFHAASPRNVTPAVAAKLSAAVPDDVRKVAVTMHPTQALVDTVLAEFAPTTWQTDAEDFSTLVLPETIERWPVFRVGRPLPSPLPPRFLFEGAVSGAGQVANWEQARSLAAQAEVMLGGGLSPDNVAAAIAQVRPWGVDVSSGVESSRGVKDLQMISRFVAAARLAAAGVGS